MTETIIAAIISAASAIAVCVITNAIQASATKKLLDYRLSQLEQKVDKHNNLIERTYALEKDVAIIKTELEESK